MINSVGQSYISNNTEVEVLINSLQAINKNDIPRFGISNSASDFPPLYALREQSADSFVLAGTPFLSSAYLMVDNDHEQFTLWKSQQSQTSNLIAIGPPACNSPIPTPTAQSLPSVLASPPAGHHRSTGVPKGAIAGAVIGGLAIIGLCMGAFLMRKRRRTQHRQEQRQEQERQEYEARVEATKNSVYSDDPAYLKPEMPSDKQPPQEMPLEQDTGYSIAPYEMHSLETHEMPATPRLRKLNTPELGSSHM